MLLIAYHAIEGPTSPVCATPAQLKEDLEGLAEAGYTYVSLDDCADWLAGQRTLPMRCASVTFDDAYATVVSNGLPILTRLRVPATVFVIGSRIGGNNQWAGQWRSIPSMRLADAGELRELVAAGIAIGSHSWTHPILGHLDNRALVDEIEESADRLEGILETPVRHFAYPYGLRGAREVAVVRRRYRTAVNAEPRLVDRESDPHDLCRLDCHDVRLAMRLKWLAPPVMRPYLSVRRNVRRARRELERLSSR